MSLTVFSRGQGKDPDSSKVVSLGADPLNGALFTQEVPTYHYFDPTLVKNTDVRLNFPVHLVKRQWHLEC